MQPKSDGVVRGIHVNQCAKAQEKECIDIILQLEVSR